MNTRRPTADNGEWNKVDERWNNDGNVQQSFFPVVQPHQDSPAGAATAAVISAPQRNSSTASTESKILLIYDSFSCFVVMERVAVHGNVTTYKLFITYNILRGPKMAPFLHALTSSIFKILSLSKLEKHL